MQQQPGQSYVYLSTRNRWRVMFKGRIFSTYFNTREEAQELLIKCCDADYEFQKPLGVI